MLDIFEEEVAEVLLDEVELLWDVELEEEATELLLPSSLVSSSSLSPLRACQSESARRCPRNISPPASDEEAASVDAVAASFTTVTRGAHVFVLKRRCDAADMRACALTTHPEMS